MQSSLLWFPNSISAETYQGPNIKPLAIAIVEMNVDVIAASLIVMGPYFKAIPNAAL